MKKKYKCYLHKKAYKKRDLNINNIYVNYTEM